MTLSDYVNSKFVNEIKVSENVFIDKDTFFKMFPCDASINEAIAIDKGRGYVDFFEKLKQI